MRAIRIAPALILIGLAACSRASGGHNANALHDAAGRPLRSPARALSELTATFTASAAAAHNSLGPSAACWWVTNGWTTVTGAVCGPVAAAGDPIDGYWQTATLTTTSGSGSTELKLGATGQMLPDGSELVGGDGSRRVIRLPGGSARTLAVGQVDLVSDPAVPMTAPTDGRLALFDRLVNVEGLAAAHTAGTGADRYSAPPGAHLVVATVSGRRIDPGLPINPVEDTFKAVLRFDGTATDLSLDAANFASTVRISFAVAVPDNAPQAMLEVSEFGLAQRFDLISGRRAPPDYPALYRSPDATAVTARSVPQAAVLKADFLPSETDQLTAVVGLGGFSVMPPTPVSDPATAALTVQVLGPIGGPGIGPAELDPSKVNVTVTAPTPGPAGLAGSAEHVVSCTVPADTTAVSVNIAPDGIAADSGTRRNVAPISFPVTLPTIQPTSAATGGPNAAAALAAAAATLTTPSTGAGSIGGRRFPTSTAVAALIIVGVVAGVIVLAARRRRPAAVVNQAAWAAVLHPATVAVPYIPSTRVPEAQRSSDPPEPAVPEHGGETSETVLAATGHVAETPASTDVVVKVLGPIDIDGLLTPTDRPVVIELLVWLAFHRDRPRPGEVIRAALRPADEAGEGPEPLADTLQTYASRLRRAVGADRLPNAKDIGGYQLVQGVTTDLEQLDHHVALADAEPADSRRHLRAALNLVRGAPFEGCGAAYNWAWTESWVGHADKAIIMAAHRMCALALGAGEVADAWWAAEAGLRGSPHAFLLHQDHLAAAADAAQQQVAWEQAVRALGAAEASRLRRHPG
ncbi:MAG: hypothetical protein ACYDH6_24590 [Acidimicrobiales bacterium]